jgi:hypothetical protein
MVSRIWTMKDAQLQAGTTISKAIHLVFKLFKEAVCWSCRKETAQKTRTLDNKGMLQLYVRTLLFPKNFLKYNGNQMAE